MELALHDTSSSSDEHDTSNETIDLDMTGDGIQQMQQTDAMLQPPTIGLSNHSGNSLHRHQMNPSHQQPSSNNNAHVPMHRHTFSQPNMKQHETHPVSAFGSTHLQNSNSSVAISAFNSSSSHHPSRVPPSTTRKTKFEAHFHTTLAPDQSNRHPTKIPRSDSSQSSVFVTGTAVITPQTQGDYRSLDEDDDESRKEEEPAFGLSQGGSLFDEQGKSGQNGFHPANQQHSSAAFQQPLPTQSTQWIRLNVGGTIFQTTPATLFAEAGSYFHSRFSDRWWDLEQPGEWDGCYFIDRDGTHFRHVLNWLRDRELLVSDEDSLQQILREAEFYVLHGLAKHATNKLSEINLAKINFENSAPVKQAAPRPLPQPPQNSFMQSMLHGGRNPHGPRAHRDLSKRWGMGGMAGAGPTAVITQPSTALATSSSSSASMPQMPGLPTRTNSCPSTMHALPAPDLSVFLPQIPQTQLQPHQRTNSGHFTMQQQSSHQQVDDQNHDMEEADQTTPPQQPNSEFVFSLAEDF